LFVFCVGFMVYLFVFCVEFMVYLFVFCVGFMVYLFVWGSWSLYLLVQYQVVPYQMMFVSFNTMDSTRGAETAHSSIIPQLTQGFL
jgi:hypothetical protein